MTQAAGRMTMSEIRGHAEEFQARSAALRARGQHASERVLATLDDAQRAVVGAAITTTGGNR